MTGEYMVCPNCGDGRRRVFRRWRRCRAHVKSVRRVALDSLPWSRVKHLDDELRDAYRGPRS